MAETDTILTTPPENGLYQCTLMHYGNQANTTQEVRFYSQRCGWLVGKNEVVIKYEVK